MTGYKYKQDCRLSLKYNQLLNKVKINPAVFGAFSSIT